MLIATSIKGVSSIVTGRQRVPMAKPKGLFSMWIFLEPNTLAEWELARIWAESHIINSMVIQIPGSLEFFSYPDKEVMFFTNYVLGNSTQMFGLPSSALSPRSLLSKKVSRATSNSLTYIAR